MFEAAAHLAANPYLKGNHTPTTREVDLGDLPVTGRLPDDLAGVYMRNGPNPKYEPISYTYPFDGDGMIHAVYFDRGRARYRNRFVRTAGLAAEDRAGRAIYGSVAQPFPVDPGLLRDGDPTFVKNAANINVIQHGGHYLALYEASRAHEITRDLDTVGVFDFGGAVPAMTAHPRVDRDSGELHFFTYGFTPPFLTYYVADAGGNVTVTQAIDLPKSSMIHDFVITGRHVVFVDCPAGIDLQAVARGESAIAWEPERGCRVVILDRARPDRPPLMLETEAFFVYHFANAFDRGEEIVIDYVRHRFLTVDAKAHPEPAMHRMVVDTKAGSVRSGPIDDPGRSVEFPRSDDRRTGRPYRLSYAVQQPREVAIDEYEQLIQYDVENDTVRVHDPGPGRHPGEACFVPRDGAGAEDDGYVLAFVHDDATNKADLLILDAADFDGEPVATIHLPVRVPYGLHGNWMAIESG